MLAVALAFPQHQTCAELTAAEADALTLDGLNHVLQHNNLHWPPLADRPAYLWLSPLLARRLFAPPVDAFGDPIFPPFPTQHAGLTLKVIECPMTNIWITSDELIDDGPMRSIHTSGPITQPPPDVWA